MMCRAKYIRLGDRLVTTERVLVMAVINATPDSFFAPSRSVDVSALRAAFTRAVDEGADIIDIGACSTRPAVQSGANGVADESTEWQRLCMALQVASEMKLELPLSVDTFRPEVARRALEEYGVAMLNDISGGCEAMYELVARYKAAYVLTYNRPADAPATIDHLLADAMDDLSRKADSLHRLGVSDIVIDPGFGFNQTVEQSLHLLHFMRALTHIGCPVLAGISRKRMAYQPAGLTPDTCLSRTLELERIAVAQGATILRAHDVAATIQMINNEG